MLELSELTAQCSGLFDDHSSHSVHIPQEINYKSKMFMKSIPFLQNSKRIMSTQSVTYIR